MKVTNYYKYCQCEKCNKNGFKELISTYAKVYQEKREKMSSSKENQSKKKMKVQLRLSMTLMKSLREDLMRMIRPYILLLKRMIDVVMMV